MAAPVIDEPRLRDFESHVGDHTPRLIALFRADLAAALKSLSATRDPAMLGRTAHSVLSLAGALGCAELVACAQALVAAADANDPDAARLVPDIAAAAARACAALDARYAGVV